MIHRPILLAGLLAFMCHVIPAAQAGEAPEAAPIELAQSGSTRPEGTNRRKRQTMGYFLPNAGEGGPDEATSNRRQRLPKPRRGRDFGSCESCVFVIERIKKGTNMLLPAICSELYAKFPKAMKHCEQALNAAALQQNNIRFWLFEGCYKYETYQAKEWIKPCPSHAICSELKQLNNKPFCKPMKMEDPFR